MRITKILLCIFILTGCGDKNLEIKNTEVSGESGFGLVATTASSRMVVANLKDNRLCSEPPPEAQITSSTTFQLLLESAQQIEGQTPEAQNARIQAYRSYAEALNQLYKRSHSNQMYRDASYYLCQAYMNGALTPADTKTLISIFSTANPAATLSADEKAQLEGIFKGNITTAYMIAQIYLTKWAFNSLEKEIPEFYKVADATDKGRAEAISQFKAMLDATANSINLHVTSQANATQGKIQNVESAVGVNKSLIGNSTTAIGGVKTAVETNKGFIEDNKGTLIDIKTKVDAISTTN